MTTRFQRLGETGRPKVRLSVDGLPVTALAGDTLMVALLTNGPALRRSEFGDERRAGFCLMGACQDCWVWSDHGGRLRACTTLVAEGMTLFAQPPAPSP